MYIHQINSSYNVNMYGAPPKPNPKSGKGGIRGAWKRFKQKVLDTLPNKDFNDSARNLKKWEDYDKILSRPAENRLIMGATALVTQPAIDYCNHKVDEETREISRNRTIAKIVVGTAVGMLVRGSSYKLVEKMTNIRSKSKWGKMLLPTKNLKTLLKDNQRLLKTYRNALSTGMAILAMCVTNFAIDAPLTIFLTNYLNEKRKEEKISKKEEIKKGGLYV